MHSSGPLSASTIDIANSPAAASTRCHALGTRRLLRQEVRVLEERSNNLEDVVRKAARELEVCVASLLVARSALDLIAKPRVHFKSDTTEVFDIAMNTDDVQARLTPSPIKLALRQSWARPARQSTVTAVASSNPAKLVPLSRRLSAYNGRLTSPTSTPTADPAASLPQPRLSGSYSKPGRRQAELRPQPAGPHHLVYIHDKAKASIFDSHPFPESLSRTM